ncbi:MAG: dihydroorotase, partial [Spirochaetales bacterium]
LIEQISKNWKGTFNPKDHADLRPAEAEAKAIEFYGNCAMKEGCPLYIVHVSSEAGLNAIRKLREKGAVIYAETTPTYLFLDRTKLEGPDGPLYVMTPPLRTKKDNQALQEAVMNGEFQVIATDHCTFTRDQKLANPDVRSTYPGVPGTEEMFLLLNTLREKNPGRMTMSDLVKLMSYNPAKFFGLYPQKGSLKVGTDADITLFDPNKGRVLQDSNVHTMAKYTPYRGFEVNGEVVMTIMRGKVIMENGQANTQEGEGKFIRQC